MQFRDVLTGAGPAINMNIVQIGVRVQTRWGDRETRRGDIVRAGRTLLAERGLKALQMREVARRAGIALGTVYTYFPTKESLYVAMYAERLDEMLTGLTPALAGGDIEQVFIEIATSYRDVYAEFGKELDILAIARESGETPRTGDELVRAAGRIWDVGRALVARAGAEDPDLALTMLWSTMTGLADHYTSLRHEMHPYTWDDTVRYAARTLARGLALESRKS